MSAVRSRRQRGFTLTEVMVASAIMIIVIVGILLLYDRANRVFKTGNESAELQQNVRVAYDRMVADVRMAGFDYKRGGTLLPGQSAAPWTSGRVYSAGTIVTPTTPNGHTYRATNGGTSGPSEPGWTPGAGSTIVETGATPQITWQENGGAVYEQPDEQIEYAGDTALTVRGNYDYSAKESGDVDNGREPNLESAQFPIVTTGNSEIVTYGLVSNTAPSGTAPNTQSISFYADVHVPRNAYPGGAAESQVTITGVDLTNTHPPYTLYRFTLDNAGNVQRTALADNIRSLNFFYYEDASGQKPLKDAANTNFLNNVGGAGQYDPATAGSWNAAERQVRKKIRSIRVRVVGMNSQKDVNFGDTSTVNGQYASTSSATGMPTFASDTIAPNYRRLAVDTLIAPRNLGLTGLAQNFLQPPPQPTVTSVCFGYCGIVQVNWSPNTNNPNASYIVKWDTSPTGNFSNAVDAGVTNTYAVDLTDQDLTQTFYFQVDAVNAGGTMHSTNSPPMSASARNATQPNPPTSLSATGGGSVPPVTGKIRVSWTAPVTTSGSPSCTPSSVTATPATYLREIKGFRIFRGTSGSFAAAPGNMVLDENASGTNAPQTDGYGNFYWDDTAVSSCGTNYYYRIATVEWCVAQATYNTSGNASSAVSSASASFPGAAGTPGTPAVPNGLQVAPLAPTAPPTGMTNSVCNSVTNVCNPINLQWVKVTQDVNGNPIGIDSYEIEKTQFLNGSQLGTAQTFTITGQLTSPGSIVNYADSEPMNDPITHVTYEYHYRVRAIQTSPCPSGNFSATIVFPPPCTFSGSVVVQTGATLGDGLTPQTAWIMDAGDTMEVQAPSGTTFQHTDYDVADSLGNIIDHQVSNNSGTPASRVLFSWSNQAQGTYTATFTIRSSTSPPCTQQIVRYIQQQPPAACHLTSFDVDSSILQQTGTTYQLKLDLKNNTSENLTLSEIDFDWNPPNHITWNSVQFPSSNTIAGPGTSSAYVLTLSPKPGNLTTNDVTIPANGTRSLLLNMAKTQGNPQNIDPSDIQRICVRFTQPTQGSLILKCRILPNPSANNPNTCN
ncbi:MAG TPA: prepilin-type N-terminal cleavage/methylation domain-containing protein [Thermoanaerobaculia bacterium]|nr:prepilin-type N-terminal cleavage/methylation domain-containing protein [Thermoanaerobaculia bacterium]